MGAEAGPDMAGPDVAATKGAPERPDAVGISPMFAIDGSIAGATAVIKAGREMAGGGPFGSGGGPFGFEMSAENGCVEASVATGCVGA